jgi:cytochrome c oxidase subunit IV
MHDFKILSKCCLLFVCYLSVVGCLMSNVCCVVLCCVVLCCVVLCCVVGCLMSVRCVLCWNVLCLVYCLLFVNSLLFVVCCLLFVKRNYHKCLIHNNFYHNNFSCINYRVYKKSNLGISQVIDIVLRTKDFRSLGI